MLARLSYYKKICKYVFTFSGEICTRNMRNKRVISPIDEEHMFLIVDILQPEVGVEAENFVVQYPVHIVNDKIVYERTKILLFFVKITKSLNDVIMNRRVLNDILLKQRSPNFLFLLHDNSCSENIHSIDIDGDVYKKQIATMNQILSSVSDTTESTFKRNLFNDINNIKKRLEIRVDKNKYYMFFRMINSRISNKQLRSLSIIFQIIFALKTLNSIGIIHCDIHPRNIVMDKSHFKKNSYFHFGVGNEEYYIPIGKMFPCIIDFGLSQDGQTPQCLANDLIDFLNYVEIKQFKTMRKHLIGFVNGENTFDFEEDLFMPFQKFKTKHKCVNDEIFI